VVKAEKHLSDLKMPRLIVAAFSFICDGDSCSEGLRRSQCDLYREVLKQRMTQR
jgi:hypothetical protein